MHKDYEPKPYIGVTGFTNMTEVSAAIESFPYSSNRAIFKELSGC